MLPVIDKYIATGELSTTQSQGSERQTPPLSHPVARSQSEVNSYLVVGSLGSVTSWNHFYSKHPQLSSLYEPQYSHPRDDLKLAPCSDAAYLTGFGPGKAMICTLSRLASCGCVCEGGDALLTDLFINVLGMSASCDKRPVSRLGVAPKALPSTAPLAEDEKHIQVAHDEEIVWLGWTMRGRCKAGTDMGQGHSEPDGLWVAGGGSFLLVNVPFPHRGVLSNFALLRVSKQLFEEAAPIAYENRLSFADFSDATIFFKAIGSTIVHVKHVAIEGRYSKLESDGRAMFVLLAKAINLRSVAFEHGCLCGCNTGVDDIVEMARPCLKKMHEARNGVEKSVQVIDLLQVGPVDSCDKCKNGHETCEYTECTRYLTSELKVNCAKSEEHGLEVAAALRSSVAKLLKKGFKSSWRWY
ncbi:hypothetical protein LTR56_005915 [Elasticomyces elasticus]|nr:hypothetical protein LTR56_005915 [Elasticomyces elasticus]KAK3664860.1 hypothetical protein LTR22_004166 [Elasticomyces elasticus]KAK4912746.1 hypothetical protein LTR49_018815 [Elasticomyces elasticus]KAK5752180.1 hypothetical protein LTS12_017775 [Elasticomyces elasticus]